MDQPLKWFQSEPKASRRIARPDRCDRLALMLQGGGALGAYQAGVYQALQEVGLEPDWVSGVSIGAINGAIIAGNPPGLRLERLRTFWERITQRKVWQYTPDGDIFRQARNATSSWRLAWSSSGDYISAARPADLTKYFLGCGGCQGHVYSCVEMHVLEQTLQGMPATVLDAQNLTRPQDRARCSTPESCRGPRQRQRARQCSPQSEAHATATMPSS